LPKNKNAIHGHDLILTYHNLREFANLKSSIMAKQKQKVSKFSNLIIWGLNQYTILEVYIVNNMF
jgi:hypothetical protein